MSHRVRGNHVVTLVIYAPALVAGRFCTHGNDCNRPRCLHADARRP